MRQSDAYSRYLADISEHERITPERESELSRIIQTCKNDEQVEAAVNELIHANLRLVIHCQKEFEKYRASSRLSIMDLIAEGNIGLMKAAQKFNSAAHSHGGQTGRDPIRFSTYACKCIKSHMIRAIKKARFIHIPEHHFSYWGEIEKLQHENDNKLSDNELCDLMDLSSDALAFIKMSAGSGVCRLEELTAEDSDNSWCDFIANEDAPCPADEVERQDLRAFLFSEMSNLAPRTKQIITMLYFNESSPTLKDLSRMFGISSERCRQICVQGLTRLRRQMFARRHAIEPSLKSAEAYAA
jgi:RNA polymerase primary sigma factor